MNNFGYIYKTECLKNGKVYIGQKKGQFNPSYLGSGLLITRAINKYGQEYFRVQVLDTAENKYKLDILEKRFIADYRQLFGNKIYNIADGGQGGAIMPGGSSWNKGKHIAKDVKKKISEKLKVVMNLPYVKELRSKVLPNHKGINNPFYGKQHSAKTKEILRKKQLGKKHTSEERQKIRLANIGIKNPMYGKKAWNKGKKTSVSVETSRLPTQSLELV